MAAGKYDGLQRKSLGPNQDTSHAFLQPGLHLAAEKNMKEVWRGLQSTRTRQSETKDIEQEERAYVGGGEYGASPPNDSYRPYL